MSLKDESISSSIDTQGQVCPYPLISVRRELKEMRDGDVLEVVVDYGHAAEVSIPEWCRKNEVEFEVIEIEDRLWKIYLKK